MKHRISRAQQAGRQAHQSGAARPGARPGARGQRSKSRGQALVEMAFVTMVLMLLSLGIVQFGIVYSTSIQLTNLAREGARYGAIHGSEANVEGLIEDYIQGNCKGTTISSADLNDGKIAVSVPSPVAGQPLTVTLVYDMKKKFFIPKAPIGFLSDADGRWSNFTQRATMTIE